MATLSKTNLILLAVLGLWLVLQWELPWWTAVVAAVIVGYLTALSRMQTGLVAAGVIAFFWLVTAAYYYLRTDGILTNRISELLHLNGVWGVFAALGIMAALVGSLGGIVGYEIRKLGKVTQS